MRLKLVLFFIAFFLIALPDNAAATLLFHEDFNLGDDVVGVPVTPEADNDWWGARFDSGDGPIEGEIMLNRWYTNYRFAEFEDNAGILINISTLNYTAVAIDFKWRTVGTETTDIFRMGWFDGDITGFDGTTRTSDLTSGDASWSYWTELLAGPETSDWIDEAYSLPNGEQNLWIAFWLDNGDDARGRVDDININGNIIPEPATLSLLGLGLAGILKFRRKRKDF